MVFENSSNCELSKFPNTAERVRILLSKGKESDPPNALADTQLTHHQHTTKYLYTTADT